MKTTIAFRNAPACVEALESRIAPASILQYTDVDGDKVTVTASAGDLNGHATFAAHGVGQLLTTLDLTAPEFHGADLTVTVEAHGGNGLADVGYIKATGNDLNSVIVRGDLGRITAGDSDHFTPAVQYLRVNSLGGSVSGAAGSGGDGGTDPGTGTNFLDLNQLLAPVTQLLGSHDLIGGVLDAAGNLLTGKTLSSEGQRLLSNVRTELQTLLGSVHDGVISTTGGGVQLLGALLTDVSKLLGLSTSDQAQLGTTLTTALGSLALNVSGALTGQISSTALTLTHQALNLGSGIVTTVSSTVGNILTGSVDAALSGGGSGSAVLTLPEGTVDLGAVLGSLCDTLGQTKSLLGSETLVGSVISALPVTAVNLLHIVSDTVTQLLAADVPILENALINVADELTALLSGGTLSGQVAHDLSLLHTTVTSVLSAAGHGFTTLVPGVETLLTTLSGSISSLLSTGGNGGGTGGTGGGSGSGGPQAAPSCDLAGGLGTLVVKGDISNVFLNILGNLGSAHIGGSLVGDGTIGSGEIYTSGDIGSIRFRGSFIGGGEMNSGTLHAAGSVGTVKIRGSLIGGIGTNGASVVVEGDCGRVLIGGDISGREGLYSGSITDLHGSIGKVKVRGTIAGGEHDDTAAIWTHGTIGKLKVKGSVLGDTDHQATISVQGANGGTGKTIGQLRVGGSVIHSDLLAGFDSHTELTNGSAWIGKVFVGHDWTASSLSSGVADTNDDGYGNSDDRGDDQLISKISMIIVRGLVQGTQAAGDHYGFTADQIGRLVVGHTVIALHDNVSLAQYTNDVTVNSAN